MRNLFRLTVALGCLMLAPISSGLAGEMKSHRLVIQVDQNDPAVMNLALNNRCGIASRA